jgi:hypothetical protein
LLSSLEIEGMSLSSVNAPYPSTYILSPRVDNVASALATVIKLATQVHGRTSSFDHTMPFFNNVSSWRRLSSMPTTGDPTSCVVIVGRRCCICMRTVVVRGRVVCGAGRDGRGQAMVVHGAGATGRA